ncbi:hypothetical protein N7478_008930 [Penicillium angulare]|uniref:uncharacterized protein n=1 Tax=Penicillium angulare TaxID=116970 RepID=UPI00254135A7|nr:uncharacterized protein N7478_008930 [Penicillium angulare]KAJ5273805.1 hypothetical protein N7478_008930 [Penicillium angulare]
MALVRDPYFWKRFSTAVHLDEESNGSPTKMEMDTPTSEKPKDTWLDRERRKSKKSLIWGFVIFFCIILLVTGGVIVWWLSKHNWLQSIEP